MTCEEVLPADKYHHGMLQASFKREVSETFLRCVRDGFEKKFLETELNSLKIAEHKDFADCARYILTTLLALCLPAPPRAKAEYRSLFPESAPETATPVRARLYLHFHT